MTHTTDPGIAAANFVKGLAAMTSAPRPPSMSTGDPALKAIERYHVARRKWSDSIFNSNFDSADVCEYREQAFDALDEALRTVPTTSRELAAYLRLINAISLYAIDPDDRRDAPVFAVADEHNGWQGAISGTLASLANKIAGGRL